MIEVQKNREKMLIGSIGIQALREAPYLEWYEKSFENYQVNDEVILALRPLIKNLTFKVFMGTWCPDSHKFVPAFFKVLEASGYITTNVSMIAVDRDKIEPKKSLQGQNIELVPTIIVYRNDEEIGRITEKPDSDAIESDLVTIASK